VSNQSRIDARLQVILSDLLQVQLGRSMQLLDEGLDQWRNGDISVFEAHAEVLKHAARAERMANRVANVDPSNLAGLLRDAFDAGLVGRDEFMDITDAEPDDITPLGGLDDGLSTPLKRELVVELLDRGPVLVHVDARAEQVSIPQQLTEDPKLVLRFGFGLTPAIPDIELSEDALSGTLTFNGVPHHCILPWPSVYAVVSEVDQNGMVWPEDVPKEVLEEMAQKSDLAGAGPVPAARESIADESRRAPSPRRSGQHLKLVD
jgi:stringent starvation protein B